MRKSTLPMILMVLTVLTTGCEPRGNDDTQSARPVHCDVVADSPARVEKTDQFAGVVRFRCATPGAEQLNLRMRVERQDGEKWHTVATATHTVTGRDNYAAELKYQSRTVTGKCATGVFRTVVDWSRVSRKDVVEDTLESPTMRDPCRVPIFG
jgi:hypothetical protein